MASRKNKDNKKSDKPKKQGFIFAISRPGQDTEAFKREMEQKHGIKIQDESKGGADTPEDIGMTMEEIETMVKDEEKEKPGVFKKIRDAIWK